MKTMILAAGLAAMGAATAGDGVERKVYAHFMGCWPAQGCLQE